MGVVPPPGFKKKIMTCYHNSKKNSEYNRDVITTLKTESKEKGVSESVDLGQMFKVLFKAYQQDWNRYLIQLFFV